MALQVPGFKRPRALRRGAGLSYGSDPRLLREAAVSGRHPGHRDGPAAASAGRRGQRWVSRGRDGEGCEVPSRGSGRASSPQSVLIKTRSKEEMYRFIAASPHCSWHVEWLWSHPNRTSLVARMIKRLSKMWENRVRSLGRKDPLEKEMATHSSTIAWKIPWMEEPARLQSVGSQRVGHDWTIELNRTKIARSRSVCIFPNNPYCLQKR